MQPKLEAEPDLDPGLRKDAALGARLRSERERLRLCLTDFARAVNVAKSTQLKYERGERRPTLDYALRLNDVGADWIYIVAGQYTVDLVRSRFPWELLQFVVETVVAWSYEQPEPASPELAGKLVCLLCDQYMKDEQVDNVAVQRVLRLMST